MRVFWWFVVFVASLGLEWGFWARITILRCAKIQRKESVHKEESYKNLNSNKCRVQCAIKPEKTQKYKDKNARFCFT